MQDSCTLFHEHQSLLKSHAFIQVILLVCVILAWWGFIQQIWLGIPFGSNPASDAEMIIIWVVVGWLIPALLIVTRLDIEVTQTELRFQYRPFHLSTQIIARSLIFRTKADMYRPLAKFYGWGIRYRDGIVAYTVSGGEGVYITYQTADGKEKEILLGSQRAAELEQVLSGTMKK